MIDSKSIATPAIARRHDPILVEAPLLIGDESVENPRRRQLVSAARGFAAADDANQVDRAAARRLLATLGAAEADLRDRTPPRDEPPATCVLTLPIRKRSSITSPTTVMRRDENLSISVRARLEIPAARRSSRWHAIAIGGERKSNHHEQQHQNSESPKLYSVRPAAGALPPSRRGRGGEARCAICEPVETARRMP